MAVVGVVATELVVVYRSVKHNGPDRIARYMRSWFFWRLVVAIATVAGAVAYVCHEHASPLGWFYFGATFPVLVSQVNKTAADD